MEACHVKRGQGSCSSIPQIPVGKLAYQNCNRDQLSRAESGSFTVRSGSAYLQKLTSNLRGGLRATPARPKADIGEPAMMSLCLTRHPRNDCECSYTRTSSRR